MYEYEKVGRIFVDSGQIAVGDPCYTLGHPEDIGDGNLKLARDKDGGWLHDENGTVIEVDETIGRLNAYSKFCQATLTGDKPYGIIDGSYQVTIVKDSFGTQRGIYICLDGSDPDIEVKEDDDSYL